MGYKTDWEWKVGFRIHRLPLQRTVGQDDIREDNSAQHGVLGCNIHAGGTTSHPDGKTTDHIYCWVPMTTDYNTEGTMSAELLNDSVIFCSQVVIPG